MQFAGKVAIVTGAWGMKTIGRSCALALAREGCDVAVSDIERPADRIGDDERAAGWLGIASLAQEIEGMGRRARAIPCDITQPAQVEALVSETVRSLGRVDILVNAARAFMGAEQQPVTDIDESQWDWVMAVNLRGPMTCTKFAAREMIKAGRGGAIINISSLAAKLPSAGGAPYNTSKAALNMLTHISALELATKGIRVNAICPGVVYTNRVSSTDTRRAKEMGISYADYRAQWVKDRARAIPLGRVAEPDEIAAAAVFLASDASSYMIGQCINVDGGMVME